MSNFVSTFSSFPALYNWPYNNQMLHALLGRHCSNLWKGSQFCWMHPNDTIFIICVPLNLWFIGHVKESKKWKIKEPYCNKQTEEVDTIELCRIIYVTWNLTDLDYTTGIVILRNMVCPILNHFSFVFLNTWLYDFQNSNSPFDL